MNIRIEVQGLREVQGMLSRFPGEADRALTQAMEASVGHLQDKMADYPVQITGRKVKFVSAKQRRYFFWALKKGIITVPYRRTGTLGRRWTTRVTHHGRVIRGVVGNNTRYAQLVQGPEGTQAREMGARGWQRVDDVFRRERRAVEGYFRQAVENLVRRMRSGGV